MTTLTQKDLQDIYGDTISLFPFNTFTGVLEKVMMENEFIPFLNTRNKGGQLRKYKGEYYFPLKIGTNNVFFGGNENTPDGRRVPTIKIDKNNRSLHKIPPELTFPSQDDRGLSRICIILSSEIIDVLFDVMQAEIDKYKISHEKQFSPQLKDMPLMAKENTNDTSNNIPSAILIIIGIIVGLIGLFNYSVVGALLGFIIFILGGAVAPNQPKNQTSFEEARYYILGHGNPPNTNIKSKNGITKTRKRTRANVRQTARTVNKLIRLFR